MNEQANKDTAAEKEAKDKANREKIEKIALQIKNTAFKIGQAVLPIAKKAFASAISFIKEQLEKRKSKTVNASTQSTQHTESAESARPVQPSQTNTAEPPKPEVK